MSIACHALHYGIMTDKVIAIGRRKREMEAATAELQYFWAHLPPGKMVLGALCILAFGAFLGYMTRFIF